MFLEASVKELPNTEYLFLESSDRLSLYCAAEVKLSPHVRKLPFQAPIMDSGLLKLSLMVRLKSARDLLKTFLVSAV